jgi:hypothetical protein
MSPAKLFDPDNKIGFRVLQIQLGGVYSWIRGAFLAAVFAPPLEMLPPVVAKYWNFVRVQSC